MLRTIHPLAFNEYTTHNQLFPDRDTSKLNDTQGKMYPVYSVVLQIHLLFTCANILPNFAKLLKTKKKYDDWQLLKTYLNLFNFCLLRQLLLDLVIFESRWTVMILDGIKWNLIEF